MVKMKMGEVQHCVMDELQDLKQLLDRLSAGSGGGGASDPSALMEKLKDDTFQYIILPSIGDLVCE